MMSIHLTGLLMVEMAVLWHAWCWRNDDSSQFSGGVSDEVIKYIYEATEFGLAPSVDGTNAMDNGFSSEVKFHINQVSATISNFGQVVIELVFEGMFLERKLSRKSTVITASINSERMINPFSKQDVFLMGKVLKKLVFR